MSQENVELTRLFTDAFNRRDVDATVAHLDEKSVWYPAIEAMTEGRKAYRGPAGMRRYYRDLAEFSVASQVEWSEIRDLGDRIDPEEGARAPEVPVGAGRVAPTRPMRRLLAAELGAEHAQQSELAPVQSFGDKDGEIAALPARRPQHAILV